MDRVIPINMDRQTDGQGDSYKYGQRDRVIPINMDRQTDGQGNSFKYGQTDRWTGRFL